MNGCFIIARFLARDGHAQHTQQLLQTLLQTSRNEIGVLSIAIFDDSFILAASMSKHKAGSVIHSG